MSSSLEGLSNREFFIRRSNQEYPAFVDVCKALPTYIRPMGGKVPSIYGPSADAQARQ
jgi:hypothetical protein